MLPPPPPAPNLTELKRLQDAQVAWCAQHRPEVLASVPPPPAPRPVPAPLPTPPPPAPPAKPRLSGKGVRAKGQRGEREVVKLLQAIVDKVHRDFPHIGAAPTLQRNALQAHLGGEDIHGLEGFSVEVKFQENVQVGQWWKQALAQAAKANAVPVLFWRQSAQKFKVRFRACVSTPGDRDQIEMDLDVSLEEFTEWFGYAYAEKKGVAYL